MLARLAHTLTEPAAYALETKWDGVRVLCYVDRGTVRLTTRNHNDVTHLFPELGQLPSALAATRAVLDGEVVVIDADGRSSFGRLQQRLASHWLIG